MLLWRLSMRFLPLLFLLGNLSASCALQGLQNKNQAKRESEEVDNDLKEDANRPFQALLTQTSQLKRAELWQPTGSTSLWTPKGDATFYAGRGAIFNFEAKTVQFVTKNTMEGRVYSEVHKLSDDVWANLQTLFVGLNRVERSDLDRSCSPGLLEGQTNLELQFAGSQKVDVLNYRTAPCKALYVDTLSFERLFDWLTEHGAPWVD